MRIPCGPRKGAVTVNPSKSHLHRLLIADFLAGDRSRLVADLADSEDIRATKRCLLKLAEPIADPELDCGESGSTLRFLMPIAAALGKRPSYKCAGRLAQRPRIDYPEISSGVHEIAGNVSSQFVTGLLFALPLLKGDSEIRFTSPLQSRGYVDMTLRVLRDAGIAVNERENGFFVPGGQVYRAQRGVMAEGDWSGASFWLAMNALGSQIEVNGLAAGSAQPDSAIFAILNRLAAEDGDKRQVDVSSCPDIFPPLAVVAAGIPKDTIFTGIARLRIKESDRVAAMQDVLTRLGVCVEVTDAAFVVHGTGRAFAANQFTAYSDHRIAMSVAVAATRAEGSLELDNAACAAKSYPAFFETFFGLESLSV